MLNHRFLPLSLVMAATLAACAMTPPNNAALEEARRDYAAAQSNMEVVRLAPDEMTRAGDALNKANDAWTKGEDSAKVDQLAYVAKQRVAIAQATSRQKTAEAASAVDAPAREPAAADDSKAKGILVLGSKPPCEIAIDGSPTGLHTPQTEIKLTPGRHKVTLVNSEFGIKESFNVDIKLDAPEKMIKDYSDRLPNP